MASDPEVPEGDATYFDEEPKSNVFAASLLREPLGILPARRPLVFSASATVREAMHQMQQERRGCVLITEDGTGQTRLVGIFTERDILYRIVDGGRDPVLLPLGEVMTRNPESVPQDASLAWVLHHMAVGGFRHVPVVDQSDRPIRAISVRDVVQFLVDSFPQEVLNLPPQNTSVKQREGA